ncbi:tRNA pseudouridine(65) synthase TruC [Simiduia aestuariiviva]|uniref:tRNA pseudouridine synthase C n=1 Tax=Simiduia aestuariiviva TaxID=1510459 RepID=A0A839UPZ2_9GAMM|nr:tRNA pseudouridine(65) synthase TruC [Simiduia aestuariiviva]MBB3168570.1 tRNA pseudouridine65 synthase [Simiduia aestuariiviva]
MTNPVEHIDTPEQLPLIFQDEHLVVINKPSGLLVHRSPIDRHETRFAVQLLRDQIGQHVYPVHRLDKPTSGLLVFALNADIARAMSDKFNDKDIQKNYLAMCRGYMPSQRLDYPLSVKLDRIADKHRQQDKAPQSAITNFTTLATCELPYPVDRYPVARYSLVLCQPETGRKHQIRRHLKHAGHPIIGDAKHGKSVHNRFFAEHFSANHLLLSAVGLDFSHPVTGEPLSLRCPAAAKFIHAVTQINWQEPHWKKALDPVWLAN